MRIDTQTQAFHLADVIGTHTEVRVLYGALGASVEFIDGANVVRVWLIPLHEIRMVRVDMNEPTLKPQEVPAIE